jgi:PAS domain S-box-containing protein
MTPTPSAANEQARGAVAAHAQAQARRFIVLAGWPIPILLVAMALLWVGDDRAVYEWPAAQLALHVLTRTLSALVVLFLVGRSFLARGEPGLLLLGCGVAIWGGAGLLTGVMLGREANVSVTISNLGALCSAVCHMAAVALAIHSARMLATPGRWLGAGLVLALALVGAIALAALQGWLPLFFIQGEGGTGVRHLVLGAAVTLFAFATVALWQGSVHTVSPFARWYALALGLIAVGLIGVASESARNGLLDWVSRCAQYLSGVYMFIAVFGWRRAASGHTLSLVALRTAHALTGEWSSVRSLGLRYGFALAAVALGLALWWGVKVWLGFELPPFITFFPAITAVALLAGLAPGLLATALADAVVAYWIMQPAGQWLVALPSERVALVMFDAMGITICALAYVYNRNRRKAAAYDQEEALRAVRQEKDLLAYFLEHAAQPFCVGYADGRLGRVNRGFEALTGYSAAELTTLNWSSDLTPPQWRAMEQERLAELRRTGQPVRYEKEYVRKNGAIVQI